ncbi:hypothetical protein GDO81_014003 [Engystomops pustulosus]|uniref:FBA domain-containing protein n=1 Tax=Engystomops pustulosus TaxID=76066 RepID=A0AAV7B7A1_ENGPU|nr:hypothetical protein GDO81_014003 [Engystomops pustulosus]
MARNLIKNPCGEEDLRRWVQVQNGGNGWKVEELPGDCGAAFPRDEISKYFASSFLLCSKSQLIDLLREGYTEEQLDAQPNIVVSDWYAARTDAGCSYELKVQLLSDNHAVIREYNSGNICIPEKTNGSWKQMTYTFSQYGRGVRFIRFTHSGKDSVGWKGWYGVRVTNSSVSIKV